MKVVVGVSGGVDSAIATHILKKQGHEVIPVHFDFLSMKEFHDTVIRYFVEEYKRGATPNPCAYCNGKMKFKKLYEAMLEQGADAIATGHYANVGCENGRYFISKSKNEKKDQSYMLYTLSQDILSHLILPIGDMDKEEVRRIARELALPMAEQKDSQDICFISTGRPVADENINDAQRASSTSRPINHTGRPTDRTGRPVADENINDAQRVSSTSRPVADENINDAHRASSTSHSINHTGRPINRTGRPVADIGFDYREFIKEYDFGHDYKERIARGELKESEILEKSYLKRGEFVDKDGKVLGFHNGIINYTIGQRKGLNIAFGERKFVVAIDTEKNQVVLGDNDDLFTTDFKIKDVVFQKYDKIDYANINLPNVKVRYRHDGTKCEVKEVGGGIYSCHMLEKVRAVTKGQAAVFYDDKGDIVLGGTII